MIFQFAIVLHFLRFFIYITRLLLTECKKKKKKAFTLFKVPPILHALQISMTDFFSLCMWEWRNEIITQF